MPAFTSGFAMLVFAAGFAFAKAGTKASGIGIDGAGVETGGAGFFVASTTATAACEGARDGACATGEGGCDEACATGEGMCDGACAIGAAGV